MPTLKNSIIINAPLDSIWKELASVDMLATYDPATKSSIATSEVVYGLGAERRVEMQDGKNWFEEKCTLYKENEALKYDLTACSFPVYSLSHSYSFRELDDGQYEVSQVQDFRMKYGFIGVLMSMLIKPKWDKGIKDFLKGLKKKAEM